jgi:hypothetical protein
LEGLWCVILPIAFNVGYLALFGLRVGVCGFPFADWEWCGARCGWEVEANEVSIQGTARLTTLLRVFSEV